MKLLPAFTGAPEVNRVYHLDLFTLCAAMSPGSVDMILCDFPYGALEVGWDAIIPFAPMWRQFKRIIHPQGAIVLTAKQPFSSALLMSNPAMYRYSWYWEKSKGANISQTGYRPLAVIEEALVFSPAPAVYSNAPTMKYYPQREKMEKPCVRTYKSNHRVVADHSAGSPMRNPEKIIGTRLYEYTTPRNLLYAPTDGDGRYHPTQKPVDLFRYLIRTYTQPGELVFDPCVGSGTTAIAARQCGRSFVCGDSSLEYIEVARERLAQPYTLPMFETLPVESEAS